MIVRDSRKRGREEEKKLEPDDAWDADFSLCKVGSFAVVHSLYEQTFGMCIVKVSA